MLNALASEQQLCFDELDCTVLTAEVLSTYSASVQHTNSSSCYMRLSPTTSCIGVDMKNTLSRMQLIRHATRRTPPGASRLVHAMSAWSAKTRRAPYRHCKDARVNGFKTTAMHEMSMPRPRPPPAALSTPAAWALSCVADAFFRRCFCWSLSPLFFMHTKRLTGGQ